MLCLFFHLSTHSWHKAGRRNYPMSAPFSRSYCDHTCMTNERKQGSETGSWLREQLSLPCVPVCSALLRAPRPTRLYRGCSLFFFHPFILFFFHFEKHELHTPALCQVLRQKLGFSRETIHPLAQMHVYLQWGHMLIRKVPGRGCENGLQLVRGVWRQHPGGSDSQELRHESESPSRGGKGRTF